MNIYYTAKDLEELAEKGVTQLEIGPNVFLTDFAQVTAEQLGIKLVKPGSAAPQSSPTPAPRPAAAPTARNSAYNKPSGCQHGGFRPSAPAPASNSAQPAQNSGNPSVNRLADLVGKMLRRGE